MISKTGITSIINKNTTTDENIIAIGAKVKIQDLMEGKKTNLLGIYNWGLR